MERCACYDYASYLLEGLHRYLPPECDLVMRFLYRETRTDASHIQYEVTTKTADGPVVKTVTFTALELWGKVADNGPHGPWAEDLAKSLSVDGG